MNLSKLVLISLIFQLAFAVTAQSQTKTYSKTRKLLLKMERGPANKQLKKLFEQADIRMPDLIQALDDKEKQVSINSQVIINYLAETEGLKAIDDWKKRPSENHWMPIMNLLSEKIYFEGNDSNLVKLALKNKHLFQASSFNTGDISIKLVGYSEKTKTALLEIVQGRIFTAGWHSVIKLENDKWRLVSDSNVWVH
jgi:hypothetical protein